MRKVLQLSSAFLFICPEFLGSKNLAIMKLIKKMVFCATLSLLAFSTKIIAEAPKQDIPPKILSPKESILEYANQFGTNPNVLLKVAECESHYDPKAVGDYKDGEYLAINIYQYHKGTWDEFVKIYKKEVYDEELHRDSYQDQAKVTAYIFAKYPNLRKRWTSYVAYANGGTYTFYSKLLQKKYTVICQ